MHLVASFLVRTSPNMTDSPVKKIVGHASGRPNLAIHMHEPPGNAFAA